MPWPHTPPDLEAIARNQDKEPEGERLRRELIAWLTRNKIVSLLFDTPDHTVEIQIATLPPRIKEVLGAWGSIYVIDDGEEPVPQPQVARRIKLQN